MATYLGLLIQLCCEEGGTLQKKKKKKILLACVGSAHSGWTTLGLPQPIAACTSQVHTTQASGCSARALSQVSPVFHAAPRSKPLRFSGAPQGHRPRCSVWFLPFLGPNSLAIGSKTHTTGPRRAQCPTWSMCLIHLFSPGHFVSWVCCKSTVPGVLCVSSGELISSCDTPGRCQLSRIPGRHG